MTKTHVWSLIVSLAAVGLILGCDSALVDEDTLDVRITVKKDSFTWDEPVFATIWNDSEHTVVLDTCSYSADRLGYFGWYTHRPGACPTLFIGKRRVDIEPGKRIRRRVSAGGGGTFRVWFPLLDKDGDYLPLGLSPPFFVEKFPDSLRFR